MLADVDPSRDSYHRSNDCQTTDMIKESVCHILFYRPLRVLIIQLLTQTRPTNAKAGIVKVGLELISHRP